MKYEGYEIEEFTSDKPVVFDPPKRMVVWDDNFAPREEEVVAVLGDIRSEPVVATNSDWEHCAEIPEATKPRRATNRELAMWLARGNGEMSSDHPAVTLVINNKPYEKKHGEDPVDDATIIRKWDDAEWREPTVDYMFGEGAE